MFEFILQHPLFGLVITLVSFRLGQIAYDRSGKKTYCQPVVVGMALVILVLLVFNIPYSQYFESAKPLHLLLGPVTIALAIPLYQNLKRIRALLLPIVLTVFIASTITVGLAVIILCVFGASEISLLSMSTKSITTPIAMIVSEEIGGLASLSATFVMTTGVLGAVLGPPILDRLGIKDDGVKGFALGLTAHAVGTARALEISEECGAFSALAMGLTGIFTAIFLPLIIFIVY